MNLTTVALILTRLKEFVLCCGKAAADLHRDIEVLINDLAQTIYSLEEVRRRLEKIAKSEEVFGAEFATTHDYIREFYANRYNLSKGRTHCSDVRRNFNRINYKLTKKMTGNVSLESWEKVEESIRVITEDDESFKNFYLEALEELQSGLTNVAANMPHSPKRAWTKYRRVVKIFTARLDGLNESLSLIAEAQLILREQIG